MFSLSQQAMLLGAGPRCAGGSNGERLPTMLNVGREAAIGVEEEGVRAGKRS